jgi:hypothetical protein
LNVLEGVDFMGAEIASFVSEEHRPREPAGDYIGHVVGLHPLRMDDGGVNMCPAGGEDRYDGSRPCRRSCVAGEVPPLRIRHEAMLNTSAAAHWSGKTSVGWTNTEFLLAPAEPAGLGPPRRWASGAFCCGLRRASAAYAVSAARCVGGSCSTTSWPSRSVIVKPVVH